MAKAEKSEDPKVTYLEVLMEAKHVDTDNIIMRGRFEFANNISEFGLT